MNIETAQIQDIRVAIFEDNKLIREALLAIPNGTAGLSCCGLSC